MPHGASAMLSRGALGDPPASSRSVLVSAFACMERRSCVAAGREPECAATPAACSPSTSRSFCCPQAFLSPPPGRWAWDSRPARSQRGCPSPPPAPFNPLQGHSYATRLNLGSELGGSCLGRLSLGKCPSRRASRRPVACPLARLKDEEPERPQTTSSSSSASFFGAGPSMNLNRLDSTLPLSATASSFKASVRVLYSLATHGGLIAFGCLICQLTGTSISEMVQLEPLDVVKGLLLAVPPILLGSFLQLEFLAQSWEVARGIRDAEDEELVEYYLGMSWTQYIPVAVASAVSQEVFFRAALQGGLALAFHLGGTASLEGSLLQDLGAPCAAGMAAVSGYFPAFGPFSQLHAAVVMAAMTGSFDYATSLRSVPNVIVTDANLRALKATFGEWYQRQQLKSIYAPMFTALLAFYFGLEWILVGNLVAPIVSHSLFLAWSMQSGLARLDRARTPN